MPDIVIKEYSAELAPHFKEISYGWLEKYFGIEEADRQVLENHYEKIIAPGGNILFAVLDGKIVGTCALIRHDESLFELAKMGVLEAYQGRKIGRLLAEAIIEEARGRGAKKIFLESSQNLKAALALYHKMGFRPDPSLGVSPYSRCNVQLALTLT